MRYTFTVYERLKKEQHIDTLFHKGKAFSVFPVRFVYNVVPRTGEYAMPVQAGFSVPKKKFRSSVKRHRIRRLLVEAWRHNKHTLYAAIPPDQQLHLFLIFTDTKLPDLAIVQAAVVTGTAKLAAILQAPAEPKQD